MSVERPPETLPTVFEKGPRATPVHRALGEMHEGALVGTYRVVRHLGTGGMGSVYEAVHTEIGKVVALKLLSRDLAADPRARARFLREALAASRLEHPHVVNVTDVGAEGDLPFLVMELLRGEDLASCINRQPRGLPITEAVDILLAVSAGVFAAHQAGVVHRDLKPRNIFLARNSVKTEVEPKVLDFGISKLEGGVTGTSLTDSGALLGTVPYLAPEHIKGGTTDARSDQYALGVVLFETLTARYPHEGHTPYAVMQNIAEGRFFAPSAFRADVPEDLERRIARAMNTDPDARFASVFDFGRALLPFASARGQLIWAEYFGRDAGADPLAAGNTTAPLPPPPELAGGTALLPELSAPEPTPLPRHRPAPVRGRASAVLATVAASGVALAVAFALSGTAPWQRVRRRLMARTDLAAVPTTLPPPIASTRVRPPIARPALIPAPVAPPSAAFPSPAAPHSPAPPPPRVAPAPRMVSLDLRSHPPGAQVWLDKEVQTRGLTPLTLALPVGRQRRAVTFRLPGHQPQLLELIPSESRTVEVSLSKIPTSAPRARGPRPRRAGANRPENPQDASQNPAQETPPEASQEWSEKLLD